MEYRKQAKAAMNDKISRMTGSGDAVGVDASDWRPAEPLDADVKTGMRPVSRRQYKRGGKVDAKADGKPANKRADRAKRADGGKAFATAIVNRNDKDANQEREGKKHVGAMKNGGRAKRDIGGGLPGGGVGYIPTGTGTKSMMRQIATNGFKKGGRAKKAGGGMMGGMAPPGAPMAARMATAPMAPQVNAMRPMGGRAPMLGGVGAPMGLKRGGKVPEGKWEGSKKDEAQDAKLAKKHGMSKDAFERSAMDDKHDSQQSMKGLRSGGRAKKGGGGKMSEQIAPGSESADARALRKAAAEGFLKDYYKKTLTGRALNGIYEGLGGTNPYAENEGAGAVTMDPPQVQRQGKVDRELPTSTDPYEDRPAVEGMDAPPYSHGGGVENDLGTAVGHAIAAYHRSQSRSGRKSGGRVGKAMGGGFGEEMNNPKPKADGGKKRGGPNINITINTAPKLPPMPMGGPPLGAPPPGGDMPPGLAPDMGPPPGGPPMGAGGPPPGAMAGGPPPGGMPPKPPFKRGGAVKMKYGAGSGEGRLEKVEKYGRAAHADGGTVHMTAGAGTGEGRLQKIAAYGKKA